MMMLVVIVVMVVVVISHGSKDVAHLHLDRLMPHCGCCVISLLIGGGCVNKLVSSFATVTRV